MLLVLLAEPMPCKLSVSYQSKGYIAYSCVAKPRLCALNTGHA